MCSMLRFGNIPFLPLYSFLPLFLPLFLSFFFSLFWDRYFPCTWSHPATYYIDHFVLKLTGVLQLSLLVARIKGMCHQLNFNTETFIRSITLFFSAIIIFLKFYILFIFYWLDIFFIYISNAIPFPSCPVSYRYCNFEPAGPSLSQAPEVLRWGRFWCGPTQSSGSGSEI